MREIKFRTWDIEANKMRWIITDVHWALHGLVSCKWMSDEITSGELHNTEDWKRGKRRFELMQYTGLKDKNGKEIYESDIILWGNKNWEIVWEEDCFGAYRKDTKDLMDWWSEFEVIGNIHENPELLKEINNGS